MTENRIATIPVAEISSGGRPGTRTEHLADLARRHPDRDEYGQLLEYVVTVPDVPGLFRGRYSPYALREAAERVAAGITGAGVVASPLVTAAGRTVMVVPSKGCRPPVVGEPNHCTEHCSGPACFTQKAYPCCGLCTMHRTKETR